MACLNITDGLFYNVAPDSPVWARTGGTTTPAGVTITAMPAAAFPGISVQRGPASEFFTKPASGSIYWVTFGSPRNYILILTVSDDAPGVTGTRTVVLVEVTSSSFITHNLADRNGFWGAAEIVPLTALY